MITLAQLYPDHLNLNGDAGNLLVLEKRIGWSGFTSSSIAIQPGQTPANGPDFLLIGHGSSAAWRQVYSDLARLAPTIQQWLHEGTQVLAVSSGFAALHGLLPGLPTSVSRVERVSAFVVDEFEGEKIYGYRNTDLDLENLVRAGGVIGTMLHGPILAKNTWLADALIEKLTFGKQRGEINASKLDEIEKLAEAARVLAGEQANA